MSATISICNTENSVGVMHLVRSAIDTEISRLNIAIQLTKQKLVVYENKYNVSSHHFINYMTAEDLSGGDDEYVIWLGEFKFYQKLLSKQKTLQDLQYVTG